MYINIYIHKHISSYIIAQHTSDRHVVSNYNAINVSITRYIKNTADSEEIEVLSEFVKFSSEAK